MIEHLNDYIKAGNIEGIREILEAEDLEIKDGKIVAKNVAKMKEQAEYWDQIQLIRKIGLNSVYGASIHPASEYFDQRMGQSCTLTARCTTRHMGSHINEKITGTYELGTAIKYGDSVTGDTIIRTSVGDLPIEQLFNMTGNVKYERGKEFVHPSFTVHGYRDGVNTTIPETNVGFIVRHKTTKAKWRITTEDGKQVTVTNDHSIMIERDGNLIEVKPSEIVEGDIVLTLKS